MRKVDLYFTPEYGKLYEKVEGAKLDSFSYESPFGQVYYQYLKRPVPFLLKGEQYYDVMTPYGYGGPLVVDCESGKEAELLEGFKAALDQHFEQERIVCEFVRFHPMEKNAEFFQEMYTLWNRRTAVYTDLSDPDPVAAEFDKHSRQLIKKALAKGVTTQIQRSPSWEDLQLFQACYFENMRAIGASDYFYFSKEYFQQMWNDMRDRLILVLAYYEGELVGADLGFDDHSVYTCHLIGVTNQGRKLNVARVIVGQQVRWAAEHGFQYLFHGCGLTADEDDNLLKFKKYFTKGCYRDYWQGKRIRNCDLYDQLCKEAGIEDNNTFFPAYRMKKAD